VIVIAPPTFEPPTLDKHVIFSSMLQVFNPTNLGYSINPFDKE